MSCAAQQWLAALRPFQHDASQPHPYDIWGVLRDVFRFPLSATPPSEKCDRRREALGKEIARDGGAECRRATARFASAKARDSSVQFGVSHEDWG